MTKHLRILLIALFAIVCMGGYSQTKSVAYTISATPTKSSGDVDFTWAMSKTGTNDSNGSNGRGYGWSKPTNVTLKAELSSEQNILVKTVVINANTNATGTTAAEISLKIGDDNLGGQTITKSGTTGDKNLDYTYTNTNSSTSTDITITLNSGKSIWVKTVTIEYEELSSDVKKTTTSFVGLSGTGVVLNNGKQSDGTDFTGYIAAEEDEVAGTITYAASGDGVATVDATTGKVTVNADVYGTTTITATFTPTDADTYLGSEASYTIDNKGTKTYASIEALRTDLDNGTLKVTPNVTVKLTMTNAKVVYRWTNSSGNQELCFIREGEGDNASAVCLYNSGVGITQSKVLNGTYTGIIYNYNGMLCLTKCNVTSSADLEISGGTTKADPIEISTDDVAKHVCDLVSVKGAKVTKSGSNMIVSNGSGDGAIFYNKFKSGTTSVKNPYVGANIDLTSAIVLPYKATDEAALVYDLAPTEKYTVIYNLSEDDATSTVGAHQDVPVSLKRTFVKDEWNTLCLPFAVTADQLKKLLGDDVQVRTLSAVDGNKLTFAEATALDAETPCLVKLSTINEDNTYTIEGVDLVSTDDGRKKTTGDITFSGIYAQTDVTTEATGTPLFLGTGNKFYQAKADTKMQAFRAYFDVTTTTDPESLKAVIDGETTGIDTINGGTVVSNGRVYNLNGQYVGTSLQKLQPGVYVQNGKKVVIR